MPMHWTNKHDILLVREVLALDPYSMPKGKERADVWEAIAGHLNACTDPKFLVSERSVRDRIQLVLIRNYKKKMAEEIRATGIEVDPPTELEMAMEEITEKCDASEKDAKSQSEEKKGKLEKERKQAEDVRKQALERIGETKKRKSLEGEEDETKPRRTRRQGNDTIAYLKERSEQDTKVRQEELQLKRDAQSAQEKHQSEMMQQLLNQQQHQQSIFSAFQQQQQQQLQQMNQIQVGLMQQQQQQSQALLAVLQELAQKK